MTAETTLRVRIPLDEKPALETLAYRSDISYREFMVKILESAVARKYRPRSALPTRDTRLPMSGELKIAIRALARETGIAPEDYVLAVFRDVVLGQFDEQFLMLR